jgi:hypothetical protein
MFDEATAMNVNAIRKNIVDEKIFFIYVRCLNGRGFILSRRTSTNGDAV